MRRSDAGSAEGEGEVVGSCANATGASAAGASAAIRISAAWSATSERGNHLATVRDGSGERFIEPQG